MNNLPIGFEIIDNYIDNCQDIIEWMESDSESAKWTTSGTGTGANLNFGDYRTSDTFWIDIFSFTHPDFVHNMNKNVWKKINEYGIKWDFSFRQLEKVSVQRYYAEKNQHFKIHADASSDLPRIVSGLVYLNTVEDGGETYFPYFDLAIKPVEGRLVLFPSNFIYAHEARPPLKGVKYAAAYWAY